MNDKYSSKRKSVYFLFINGPHHVHHLIMPALTFATIQNKFKTILVSGSAKNTAMINEIKESFKGANFELIEIPPPLRYRFKWYKKTKLYPPPYHAFKKISSNLRNALAIISTSHLIPKLAKKYRVLRPINFYLYHGVGTRAYSFEKSQGSFDYLLIPGKYYKNRLINEGVCEEKQLSIVGHPKFDWLYNKKLKSEKLFNNNNPTFYYNPHWELKLTSFIKWQNIILDFFIKNNQYNLIFAPHPLIKHNSINSGYNLSINKNKEKNIIIDYESERLLDGTYLKNSDVYIGDVSSMIAYWIKIKERPCIFINAHNIDWKNNESYTMWNYGSVVNDPKHFSNYIIESLEKKTGVNKQKNVKNNFIFDNGKSSSSTLCANFLLEKLIDTE